jgi:hypothetical protein
MVGLDPHQVTWQQQCGVLSPGAVGTLPAPAGPAGSGAGDVPGAIL